MFLPGWQSTVLRFIGNYLLTVLLEAPVLVAGLSRKHSLRERFAAAFWLTGCTYPIVFFVLPVWLGPPMPWAVAVIVMEVFAGVAECLLFARAFGPMQPGQDRLPARDYLVILAANVVSFAGGELLRLAGVIP